MTLKILEDHLRKKHNLPADFHFSRWEWLKSGTDYTTMLLSGGVCPPLLSGPRKGKPNYKKMTGELNFYLTVAEIEAADLAWETETGNCSHCHGSGKSVFRVAKESNEFKPCKKCDGTGRKK